MRRALTACAFVSALALAPPSLADKGSIPFRPGARIFEPAQRAIVAWDGKTEILLLSTDMKATEDTRVLEILPLPSEPKVKKGSLDSFREANRLIHEHVGDESRAGTLGEGGPSKGPKTPPAEITFHEKIGAHDISVAKVLDADRFAGWVGEFVKKNGMEELKIPPEYRKLIQAYLADGFQWFVLDIVDLKTDVRSLDPIQYTFACDYLFYPLRISSPEQGQTSIRIIVLTPKLLAKFPALSIRQIRLEYEPFKIKPEEAKKISKDMADLLQGTEPFLRIWRCEGKLQDFTKDIIARE